MSWMCDQARNKLLQEGRHHDEWGSWRDIGANGLPGDLTREEFVASSSHRHLQNIAGTRPLQLLTWSGENWLLPRVYAGLLDRWERREGELVTRARLCSSCGDQGPYWGGWRTPTTYGYVTRCPPCSGAAFQLYTGHLRGVECEKVRRRGTQADDYLCRLCKASQASAWDHCHEHGHVRGPLCGSCNTREGKATPYLFLQLEGGALHLLECRGCLEKRTLPRRFHLDVVRAHLEQTERHGRCGKKPYARELERTHGVHRFQLECSGWHATGNWTKDVTASEVAEIVAVAGASLVGLEEAGGVSVARTPTMFLRRGRRADRSAIANLLVTDPELALGIQAGIRPQGCEVMCPRDPADPSLNGAVDVHIGHPDRVQMEGRRGVRTARAARVARSQV